MYKWILFRFKVDFRIHFCYSVCWMFGTWVHYMCLMYLGFFNLGVRWLWAQYIVLPKLTPLLSKIQMLVKTLLHQLFLMYKVKTTSSIERMIIEIFCIKWAISSFSFTQTYLKKLIFGIKASRQSCSVSGPWLNQTVFHVGPLL